jgi:hypothetical protein
MSLTRLVVCSLDNQLLFSGVSQSSVVPAPSAEDEPADALPTMVPPPPPEISSGVYARTPATPEDDDFDLKPTLVPPPPPLCPPSGVFPIKLVVTPDGQKAGLPAIWPDPQEVEDDFPTALYALIEGR